MPVTVKAEVTGAAALKRWLGEAPAHLVEDVWITTERNVHEVIKPAVIAATPRRTGQLAGSVQGSVTRLATGARGRVFSKLRYVSFVERGTARHGPARHMFQRGFEATQAQVAASYELLAVRFTERAT